MSAPKGNQFWRARSSHGRKPKFESPEQLWDACCEYFDWVEANPLWEIKSYQYQGVPVQDQIPKMRAMTEIGLCIFLDLSTTAWNEYKHRDGFQDVIKQVCDIIRTQKFQGAAAELFHPNIIARDLGLSDKSEVSGRDGGAIEVNSKVEWVVQPVKPIE